MITDRLTIENLKSFDNLSIKFEFPISNILIITGKNGIGKTSIVSAFHLLSDPQIIDKSSAINAVREDTKIEFDIQGFDRFSFSYNRKIGRLDTRDRIPDSKEIVAELPIPFGERFQQYNLIASFDAEIRVNIASNQYSSADDLKNFLSAIYANHRFTELKATKIANNTFYFILCENDRYIREDHFSSGEFFLIQLYRLITSGAKLVIIDELDVSLDAAAQVKLYDAIKPILAQNNSRLIIISHSLAFMNTVDDGCLYYLETIDGKPLLEQRSFGYIRSDLYSFKGKDRFILTEDTVLEGFIRYLINKYIEPFFEYEIISVGGEPQIKQIAAKNDADQIFGPSEHVITVVDKDIYNTIDYQSQSKIYSAPVNDIEVYLWEHRDRLLSDIKHPNFTHASSAKKTAKTFWKKVLASKQKNIHDFYSLIEVENAEETTVLINALQDHLCL